MNYAKTVLQVDTIVSPGQSSKDACKQCEPESTIMQLGKERANCSKGKFNSLKGQTFENRVRIAVRERTTTYDKELVNFVVLENTISVSGKSVCSTCAKGKYQGSYGQASKSKCQLVNCDSEVRTAPRHCNFGCV